MTDNNNGYPTDPENQRRNDALDIRKKAAELAFKRPHPPHMSNGDEDALIAQFRDVPTFIASFTKGLPHNWKTGLIEQQADYEVFRRAIRSGRPEDIQVIPLGPFPGGQTDPENPPQFSSALASNGPLEPAAALRAWESMGAGLTFDLEGPDAQAVTMPPAPAFRSAELAFEVSEVYWMAVLRDTPFIEFNGSNALVRDAVANLNKQPWIVNPGATSPGPGALGRTRAAFTPDTVFRGVLTGDNVGPYLSQFLLVGNKGLGNGNRIEDGFIQYGSIRVDQRVRTALKGRDYMTSWGAWFDVQNGANLIGRETYIDVQDDDAFRFIATPRDLATYVHFDALYEAYLNACLIMLGLGVDFDPGLPFNRPDAIDKQTGFATFGAPHILSLVTEVATRALKAVRFQKFNIHRRARPEVMGARIDALRRGDSTVRDRLTDAKSLNDVVDPEVLRRVFEINKGLNLSVTENGSQRSNDPDPFNSSGKSNEGTYLLPMAFPEGSPMHPAYGAGHATVAGACTTVLKAFFNTAYKLPFVFEPAADGSKLVAVENVHGLTVEGELNKVCSNISIGRNWAGVHYYSDYIESIRMGEEIAIGILEEQKLTFGENFTMTIPLFDGVNTRVIDSRDR